MLQFHCIFHLSLLYDGSVFVRVNLLSKIQNLDSHVITELFLSRLFWLEVCDGRLLVVLIGWMSYEVGTGCLVWRCCTFLLQGTGRTSLEEVAALDLVAVLGLGEALHELAVLVGDHHGAQVGEAGVQAGLGGQTAHITGHSLQTLLRLDDSLQTGTIYNSIQFDRWEAEVIK